MRPKRPRIPSTLAATVMLLGSLGLGCHTARLDMRAIEEPVMMNALPYAGASFETKAIGDYRGTVGDASGVAATGPNQTTSKTMLDNDAQAKAFELIGGFTDRALGAVEISASGGGANILIALLGTADVSASGQALEILPGTKEDETADAPDTSDDEDAP